MDPAQDMPAMRAAKGCVIHRMFLICACYNAVDTHTKSCNRVGLCLWPAVLPDREHLCVSLIVCAVDN